MDMASAFVNKYGYGSIPIHTIFRGMNIHLPAILMFTKGTRFWPIPIWTYKQYAKSAVPWAWKFLRHTPRWPWNCVGTIWSMWQTPCFCCLVPDIVMFVNCWDSNNIYIYIYTYYDICLEITVDKNARIDPNHCVFMTILFQTCPEQRVIALFPRRVCHLKTVLRTWKQQSPTY